MIKEGATTLQNATVQDGVGTVTLTTPLDARPPRPDRDLGGRRRQHQRRDRRPPSRSSSPPTASAPAPTVAVTTSPTAPAAGASFTLSATLTPAVGTTMPTGDVRFTATGTDPVRHDGRAGHRIAQRRQGHAPGHRRARRRHLDGEGHLRRLRHRPDRQRHEVGVGRQGRHHDDPGQRRQPGVDGHDPSDSPPRSSAPAAARRSTTGDVTFLDGDQVIGTAPVGADGKARLSRALLAGTHSLKARYEGTGLLASSTSSVLSQVVNGPSGPQLIATDTTVRRSGANLVADVTAPSGTPAGQVRFRLDGTAFAHRHPEQRLGHHPGPDPARRAAHRRRRVPRVGHPRRLDVADAHRVGRPRGDHDRAGA